MSTKPVLFNTEMMRQTSVGNKGTTRRIIHLPAEAAVGADGMVEFTSASGELSHYENVGAFVCSHLEVSPYQVGDILWARENWAIISDILGEMPGPVYMSDYTDKELSDLKRKHFRWRPSIHMPRSLARHFMRVEAVSAERLQDIDSVGIRLEGISIPTDSRHSGPSAGDRALRAEFYRVWDACYAAPQPVKRDGRLIYCSYPADGVRETLEYRGLTWEVYGNP